jgi:uncharacterized membrane protein YebE (DUF533 family)
MFGFGNRKWNRASSGGSGALGSTRLRRAAIAGLGMLAYRWWKNRQTTDRPEGSRAPVGNWQ